MTESCYHCGLPVPPATDFTVAIDGQSRDMCCAGCQAVAEAIVAGGLDDYYRHRDALPESRREAMPAVVAELGLFDHPDVQRNFVRPIGEHEREAALILEGITCAACVWLNEQHVARQHGVTGVEINYATRRARVRWDEEQTQLSKILEAIAAIGYSAHPYDATRSELVAQKERRVALWRLFVAGFGMMQVMMYAVPVYLADDGTMTADIEQLMRWASLLLTLPVILYSAAPFFARAWRDVRLARVGMDVPVALGVGSAFLASLWATLTASGEVYFDSVTMFVFFLLGGRYLEMVARQRAARGVEGLAKALPAFAQRYLVAGGDLERVAVTNLAVGDLLLVKPGETIPADGVVTAGTSSADESLLTGESRPVAKAAGDAVIGGSVNIGSPLTVSVERVGESTRLASIQRLMERAASEKPRVMELADRIAARFVGALLLVAVATGLAWWSVDPDRALWVFVAVLVVSCPCALSLATPAALTVATGALSRLGVLVTRGHAIETLARADCFVFDKTGTLTVGRPTVVECLAPGRIGADEALGLAAQLEEGSEHAIGRALRERAVGCPMAGGVSDVRAVTGQGVEGLWQGCPLRLGSVDFVAAGHGRPLPAMAATWLAEGDSVVGLADDQDWLALFRLTDTAREGAAAAIADLKALGIRMAVFSGDSQGAVTRIASALAIGDARGGMMPEHKHQAIQALQDGGATVAMVGDGVNDAPVLAQAHVSVAMGGGTDLARSQGDVVLLSNDLTHLAAGVAMARQTLAIIRQNLVWAFVYNITAVPLAMAGWITPWMAGIGMSASSLLVVLNALRLQRRNAEA